MQINKIPINDEDFSITYQSIQIDKDTNYISLFNKFGVPDDLEDKLFTFKRISDILGIIAKEGKSDYSFALAPDHPDYNPVAKVEPIRFECCDLSNNVIVESDMSGMEIINCKIMGLKINGFSIEELMREHEDKKQLNAPLY